MPPEGAAEEANDAEASNPEEPNQEARPAAEPEAEPRSESAPTSSRQPAFSMTNPYFAQSRSSRRNQPFDLTS